MLLLAIAVTAGAAERKYAVMSLVGDQIQVRQFVYTTGTRLGQAPTAHIDVTDGTLDKMVLRAASAKLRATGSSAPVLLLAQDRGLYEAQKKLLDEGGGTEWLVERVRALAGASGATHLILFTKLRREARIQLENMAVGTGVLEGVGFYIDPHLAMQDVKTLDTGQGMLASYAYMRGSLIDLGRGTVLAEHATTENWPHMFPSHRTEAVWNAMSAAEKMRSLQRVIEQGAAATIETLVTK